MRLAQDRSISRRTFALVLAGLLAVPRSALGQAGTAVRRIGRLEAGAPETPEEIREAEAPLRALGWVEGKNLIVERRYANGQLDALPRLAEELVGGGVELIIANGPNPTRAAMRATTTIPIVFRIVSDPVRSGLVASLARPGGNVTGFSASTPEIDAKMLSLLKELLPAFQRIGVFEVAGNPQFRLARERLERDCRSAGVEPIFVEVATASEIEGAVAQLTRQRAQVLLLPGDSFTLTHQRQIIDAALERGLPTTTSDSSFAGAGVLAAYSVSDAEADSRYASYVDRILRGAKPGDLPVEQPTQFELTLNLKAARTLGITIPQAVLLRADKVIR